MVKIEKTSGDKWIASMGRQHTTLTENQIGDLVIIKRMISGKEKEAIAVASPMSPEQNDLQSAINVLTSGKFPGCTGVSVDGKKINIMMPVPVEDPEKP